ncbi:polyhydroxyalkanoate synthase [Oxalobacteraceae bacterium GrIS 2.11]
MNTFEPEALVAAMLKQITMQPSWSALTAANHNMPAMATMFNATAPQFGQLPNMQDAVGSFDSMASQISKIVSDVGGKIDPQTAGKLQQDYLEKLAALWQDMLQSKAPVLDDRRFKAPEWHNSTVHAFTAAAYLLNAQFLTAMAGAVEAPKRTKQKIQFAVGQVIDAASPANFLATNPEAQSKLIQSKGESLTKGLSNMLTDMQKGRISQTDESAFEVGVNVATSEGQVVFENQMLQLIQYKPLTTSLYQRPLLIVPPCINKFYILDLQPDNSIVRYALEQGHNVFLVSWVNPDLSLAEATWDDYVESGVIEAIHVVQSISGQEKINTFGFCVGGTLLATSLAVLAARGEQVASSVTLLTTLLDFEDAGILEVFVDEMQVELREKTIGQGGLMSGRDLGSAFSSLRPNDLVWNYVQANYLKGEEPPAFDLLYWNGDGTNLPGPMFCWYLRNTYLENNLKQPGKLTVAGEPVDLSKIDAPVFIYGSREDHIVPWNAAYASLALLNPKKPAQNRFVLGASGHIAGVINPPAKMKRNYWSNRASNTRTIKTAQQWLDGAGQHPGSWWPEWAEFLAEHSGKKAKVAAKMGSAKYKAIEPAPGRYVKVPC